MNFKKISLNLLLTFGLFFSNQTTPMLKWKNVVDFGKWTKDFVWGSEEENYSKEWEAERPAREIIERLKECVANNVDPDPQDLFDIEQNKKIAEENRAIIEKAQEIRQNNNKDIIEKAKTNQLKCACFHFLQSNPIYNCRICLKTLYCNKDCCNKDMSWPWNHKYICPQNIIEEKENKAIKCLSRLKTCVDNNTNPDSKDLLIIEQHEKVKNANLKLFNLAKDLQCSKNSDLINKNFEASPKCSFCRFSPLKAPDYVKCVFCLKAFYCDSKCMSRDCKEHKEVCLKNISTVEKEKTNLQNPSNNQTAEEVKANENNQARQPAISTQINNNPGEEEIMIDENPQAIQQTVSNQKVLSDDQFFAGEKSILREHTKTYNYVGKENIKFFWLKSIDHSDENITACVAIKHEDMNEHFLSDDERNENEKIKGFLKEGTSGAHAIRNAFEMYDFLGEYDEELLENINNPAIAIKYLEGLIKSNTRTSFLEERVIEGRIARRGLASKITVLNSVLEIENTKQKTINKIIENFKNNKDYFHIFIINTADISYFIKHSNRRNIDENILEKLSLDYQRENHSKIDEKSLETFKNKQRDVNEWYVLAIEKKGDNKTCFIIDTEQENSERTQLKKQSNNIFLCSYIFNPGLAIIDGLKSKITDETKVVFKEAIKSGDLQPAKDYNPELLIHQDETKMSKQLEDSIYNSAPKAVKALINKFKLAKENRDELKTKNDDYLSKVFILDGPCGTGKSELSRVIAKKSGRKLCFINCGLLGTKYQYSESENLRNELYPIIEQCKKLFASYLVVLDEANGLTRKNEGQNRDSVSTSQALVGILDTICRGHDIIFGCTTNNAQDLPEVLRSRADDMTYKVGLPTQITRKRILELFLVDRAKKTKSDANKVDLEYGSVDIDYIAKKMKDFSIRAIESVVKDAYANALARVSINSINKKEIKVVTITNEDFFEKIEAIKKNKKDIEIAQGSTPWATVFDKLIVPVGANVLTTAISAAVTAGVGTAVSIYASKILNRSIATYEYNMEKSRLNNELKLQREKSPSQRCSELFDSGYKWAKSIYNGTYEEEKKLKKLEEQHNATIRGYNLETTGLGRDIWNGTQQVVPVVANIANVANIVSKSN